MRKKTKNNKTLIRAEDSNAQGTKANAKAKSPIANGIVGTHVHWASAMQATRGDREVGRTKER